MSKILLLGATGTIGRPLLQTLIAKGETVKAASRSGAAIAGAEGLAFDLAAPDFEAAFDGVDRLYLMLPGGYLAITQLLVPLVEAAAQRGVKIVMQSVFGVDADDEIPYRQVELAVERAGVPYVILRPNWFTDNFVNYWGHGIKSGEIVVPAGTGASSFIDVRDIADAAAAALTSTKFDNAAYNLTGPEALTYAQAAAQIGAAIGKPVTYRATSDADFIAAMVGAGVPADYAAFLAAIFHPVREGWTSAVTSAVADLTGHAPRSLADWLAQNADALA